MRILHIISQRPDSTGSGIYLQQLLKQAHRSGHLNHLICGVDNREEIDLEGITADRISTVRFNTDSNPGAIVGMSDVMPYPSRMFRNLRTEEIAHYQHLFRRTIDNSIKRWQPDLIHSHHLWLVSSLAAQVKADVPIVCNCHGSDLRQYQQCPHLGDEVVAGCRQLDRILALTQDQKNQITRDYDIQPDRIAVVGAGYDEQLFSEVNRALRTQTPTTIIYAGKLSRAKGVVWLLRALQNLGHYSYHLHLVGSGQGNESEQCLQAAEKLGDRITLHGPLSQQRLAALLQASHLFVLPSLSEGLPLVVLEALGCGCQVIATDLPGCREVAERTGSNHLVLVPAPAIVDTNTTEIDNEDRFVSHLTDAIRPFLSSKPRTIERRVDLTHFRWASVYLRIEKIWRELTPSTCHR